MEPFELQGSGLTLNQLRPADAPDVARYCADPIFEEFMATPWPYTLADAESFISEYAPQAWANGSEWTWAIRREADGPVLGVISIRLPSGMLGYWLGEPHRGQKIMSACVDLVTEAAFARTNVEAVLWEARVGNIGSRRTIERSGFTDTGEAIGTILGRDGGPVLSWTARLDRPTAGAVPA
ncbi:GNAT family N-acetyltransferase [Leucobacter aridicollis]|uniref:RimJ/RimL family protein N-acetyltransferase n=1 Tax=Leucobacter aridicollis TaxID=283878 RepID=A0A852R8E3_9MICO|nr:GNAT family N-acetyltransferase [Leucobacter aridicollis]MBL3683692.1 N-acetyltransferase [Leucobacter aridicollis]NYD26699.1 RimJ/RimL family protein N-acetyltransferase [Leucobacter aridicollis]